MASFLMSSATRIVILLRQRERELEQLLEQMDTSQVEFDRISKTVADRQTELDSKKRKFARMRKIRKAHELEPVPSRIDNHPCPDSAFNPEHLAWLKDKRSAIAELHQTITEIEADTQLEGEVNFLCHEIVNLQSLSADLQRRIQRTDSIRRNFDEECHTCHARRKAISNEVRSYHKIAKDVEAVRAGLLTRKVAIEAASNPASGLPSIVANLQKELETVAVNTEGVNEQIREYEEQKVAILSVREQERTADWMQGMDEELAALEAAIRTRKADLDEGLITINRLEKRYSKLSFVEARKRRGVRDGTNVIQMKIDDLLRQLPKEEPSPDLQIRFDLDAITQNNTEFEIQIADLQRELDQKRQKFAVEEARMRTQIHKQREHSSDMEKRIQNEIRDLKLKMAQKTFK